MATQTKSADGTFERVQDLNDRVLESARKTGRAYLDTTEKTFNGVADLQERLAGASQVEWVVAVGSAQADLTRELTKVYVSTARELLAK
jgi:Phasin protein